MSYAKSYLTRTKKAGHTDVDLDIFTVGLSIKSLQSVGLFYACVCKLYFFQNNLKANPCWLGYSYTFLNDF